MDDSFHRTRVLTLTLLGVASGYMLIPLVSAGMAVKRNLYPDRETCERDYAPGQCEATGHGGSGGGGGGRFGLSTNIETSVRGGFGRIGGVLRAIG
jgi:hypothetical protein